LNFAKLCFSILSSSFILTAGASERSTPPPKDGDLESCISSAAAYHHVNPNVLRAILRVESNMNAGAVNLNSNGSRDVGIAQINSIHFKELASHGISPSTLMDPCVSIYVAAWKISKHIAKNGNTWEAIARYHSATPAYNARYQALLKNELIRVGVLEGKAIPVPKVRPSTSMGAPRNSAVAQPKPSTTVGSSRVSTEQGKFGAPAVVFDGG
jgi:soluble lytic murein transglycosylase-like protein